METGVTRKPRQSETHAERIRRERGAGKSEPPESDLLTPDELLDTLRREVIAISRAAEMRTRELTVLATDYARGRISPEEANERFFIYSDKWGDAMYGISSFEGRTDAQILEEMADVRKTASWIKREERLRNEKNKGPSR
jgi:hypothetical protein